MPLKEIPYFSRLGQNIFRHDGLLALPKGIVLREKEIKEIGHYGIDFVLAYDKSAPVGNENDISFTLNIIESAFLKTTLWSEELGEEIYEYVHKETISNKKISKLLNDLRIADSYSFAHCINICLIVCNLLKKNVDIETLKRVAFITLLHDIGRLKMLDIFNKQGKLTAKELELLRRHPEESYYMLKKAGFIDAEVAFVSETHEKFNGTGYPYNLKGNDISDLSQIILVADVYNALSSFRPHRDSYNPNAVLKMIEEEEGRAFNNEVIELFKENFEPYKKGMIVMLNNESLARVKSTSFSKTLPYVEVIDEETGESIKNIDLSSTEEYRIKKIISV
jgi:HD-GYP domain-containing protein (c-di-GMP phosphodiesterase class II)